MVSVHMQIGRLQFCIYELFYKLYLALSPLTERLAYVLCVTLIAWPAFSHYKNQHPLKTLTCNMQMDFSREEVQTKRTSK